MDAQNPPILLFDGVCNLCNATVRFILKRDREKKFRFAALQSPAGQAQLIRLGLAIEGSLSAPVASVVLVEGDRYSQRSTAALRILRALGWPYKALYILIFIPRPLRDAAYRLIASNRYRLFGKRDACMMPTPELRARFL